MPAILLDIIIAITIVEWLVLRLMIRRRLLLSLLPGVFLVLAFKLNAPDVLSWPTVLCLAIAGIVHGIDIYYRLKRER
ncbi:MAG: hypothetical protein ACO3HS_07455 [Burkholderiaceae bacterium]